MHAPLLKAYLLELLGSFGVVFFSAGLVCINQVTASTAPSSGTTPLAWHQPGLLGIALGQGLIWTAMIALTCRHTGGYLNPAITLLLWAGNRLPNVRAALYLGAQMLGAALAGFLLLFLFVPEILQAARYGAPHVNPLVYPVLYQKSLLAATAVEVILTFFLVFAIFGGTDETGTQPTSWWASGAVMTVAGMFAYPLTGAAFNPARWFGPALWEFVQSQNPRVFHDAIVYLAGPILGSLLGGLLCFKVLPKKRESMTE